VQRLVDLIRDHGRWVDPPVVTGTPHLAKESALR